MKHIKLFEQFLNEKKPKGAPDWHDSDAPDAEGRFKDLSPKKLAAWLIKTRKKDIKKISGSLTQQIVFNRKKNPDYAEKMEKTRKEVYKQLGRDDLIKKIDESKSKYTEIDTSEMNKKDIINIQGFLDSNDVDWFMDYSSTNNILIINIEEIEIDDKKVILDFLKDKLKK
tara:strand:- start:80284 stop:80793 length:510 start_codon:yes stop_codon:yes gene_type:complete